MRPPAQLKRLKEAIKTATIDKCLLWDRSIRGGYGVVSIKNKNHFAHRLAWSLINGPIPNGMRVCHKCDNPPCFNPLHLFLGTDADNAHDRDRKNRVQHGPRHYSSKLTENQVLVIRAKYQKGTYGFKKLASEFGVSSASVRKILSGRSWKRTLID